MDPLSELVELSHCIGQPSWDAVILGEGNTSIAVNDEEFYVKGSGCSLESMGPEDFVLLRRK
ncbi:MAG: class II aldolase/adducin family protein, partial [Planctomycetes bacterium]|nr:class II aldolase/adducin family protein [Planctomycetota bacterium]